MASIQRPASSGSDGDLRIDERKRKRMISNRESARRSRMRKQKQLEDFINQKDQLRNENTNLMQRINVTAQNYNEIESANNALRAEVMQLTEQLRSLNSVLEIVEEVSGLSMDIPEIPDPLMKPWQLPYPIPANMFQC